MDSGSGGASLPSSCPYPQKRHVSYFYEPTVGNFYYGQGPYEAAPHPHGAQPYRKLLPPPAHGYVQTFLSSLSPDTNERQLKRFNINSDCPVFDELFYFCQASTGRSVGAAMKFSRQDADIAINWSWGSHHAKKSEVSRFCYVNDIVLGILEQ
ncbi:hypothetical protein CASFOL_007312 [Castilleja foliolosa]|uniref:Histone deacetylase domain-containing protein n=1 Tax=Castilleja foliolosa TaxID=1961234 RepID=A0ABD3E9R3_9LAMI